MSLAEQILGLDDFDYEEVTVPEWGNITVLMRGLKFAESAKATDAAQRWLKKHEAAKNGGAPSVSEAMKINLRSLVHCALDPATKEPIFSEADVDKLFERNQVPVIRLIAVMNRLGKKVELEKLAAEAKKNSKRKTFSDSDSSLLEN